ncbi:unnamed protein product [Dicrocoelium dendriticum]|nr:unnamed protein product [Dicrocoelium dendriticum]
MRGRVEMQAKILWLGVWGLIDILLCDLHVFKSFSLLLSLACATALTIGTYFSPSREFDFHFLRALNLCTVFYRWSSKTNSKEIATSVTMMLGGGGGWRGRGGGGGGGGGLTSKLQTFVETFFTL